MRLIAFALSIGVALAEVTVTREMRRASPLPAGGIVNVNHRYGNVVIAGAESESVTVRARVYATGENRGFLNEFARQIQVRVEPGTETVRVVTEYPHLPAPESAFGYGADLELLVPDRAGLIVANRFGDVVVAGVFGPGRLDASYGSIELERCGPLDVTCEYGDVVLLGAEGPANIESNFGRVELEDLAGAVSVRSRYGEVSAQLSDPGLALLDIISHAGRVELALTRDFPFRLAGVAHGGAVTAESPLVVLDSAGTQLVHGRRGSSGPAIDLTGSSSEFIIRTGIGPSSNRR